jgi:O-antigen/teichoic acid export membrane protein
VSVPAPIAVRGSRLAAVTEHLRVPLHRDGYALVLNSALTAVLGVVYWLLAARSYTPRVVGVNSAAISAMMFLAGLAQLNLMSALLRFVPVLGPLRRRFITVCYLVAASAAVGCAALFLLGLNLWAPALQTLRSSSGIIVWFIAATAAWCVFNLQDSALTALGAAVMVPVENVVYGVAKIVLLALLVTASPHYGVFGSWSGALLVSLLPVNALIFGPLLRRRRATDDYSLPAPTRQEILRYVAPDYLGALLWLAATTLMPLIVVAIAGPTSNAFFSLAWMVTLPLIAVSANTGAALVVSSAGDPARLGVYSRKVLLQTARLVVPAALVIALGAPYLLLLFGRQYADHGATTLSLLALSAIPNMITALHVSIYRVQRRMHAVVRLLAGLCVSVLLLGAVLLAVMGIPGVGLAWLVCQSVTAVILLRVGSTPLQAGGPRALHPALKLGVVRALRRLRANRARRRNAAALMRCLPDGLTLSEVEATVNDIAVGSARAADGCPEVMVKLALSDQATASLQRAAGVFSALQEDSRLRGWGVGRPVNLEIGSFEARCYVVESRLSGVTVSQRLAQGAAQVPLVSAAFAAIEGLHRLTAETVTVDGELLERWIDRPARVVNQVVGRSAVRTAALQRLTRELRAELEGRRLAAGWIHGDFVPENVLIEPYEGGRVTGIIDWELAVAPDLPALDTTMFLLATYAQLERRELGQLVAPIASGDATAGLLPGALADAARGPDQAHDPRLMILLCWLRHAASLISKSRRYARHPVWKRYNVYQVLDAMACDD